MCLTIILFSSALFFILGFKAAEYVYKCDALSDETEDELFENKE